MFVHRGSHFGAHLLSYLCDPVGGAIAEIRALGDPGPRGGGAEVGGDACVMTERKEHRCMK